VTDHPFIIWLDHESASGNPLLGGKFSNLAEMLAADFSVPPGFGVSTAAYQHFMDQAGLAAEATALLTSGSSVASSVIKGKASDMVAAIMSQPLPRDLETAIRHNYTSLEEKVGQKDVPVAVRSSGELEDLTGASFAGQYDTYLWIIGADSVLHHVRKCWASMFGEAVFSYRSGVEEAGGKQDIGICAGIQQMVEARAAGVMFTLDPLNGDRSKVAIEACWGLGEGVVKGDVTPSRFIIDKVTFEVIKRQIVSQLEEYAFDPKTGAVGLVPLAADHQDSACIADKEAVQLAKLGKHIEQRRSAPQDIEWAINQQGDIKILQVRPETVWSQRERSGLVSDVKSPIDHVLLRLSGVQMAKPPSEEGQP
jgi:pyruvate,water dikinase